jgi:hypothetical protein
MLGKREMSKIRQLAFDLGIDAAKKHATSTEDRKLVGMMEEFMSTDVKSIYYMFSSFALCMLPHKRVEDENEMWKRENGKVTLLVEPGAILHHGVATKYGVPYGSRARLIMFYLQTEAIRTRSPIVHLGSSMTKWMKNMNIPTGGKNFEQVRDQARRLSACRLTVGWVNDEGSSGFRRENIFGAMLIPPKIANRATSLPWEETAELGSGFYEALLAHPVPCDGRAIRVLQSKSQAIDVYIWLCYRLHSLTKEILVPWPSISQQFGQSYANPGHFRWRFRQTLDEALAVYPDARVEVNQAGLMLKPSKPAVQYRSSHQVLLPPNLRNESTTGLADKFTSASRH